jgi:hypothetical protein
MISPSRAGDEPGERTPANYVISSSSSLVEAWSAKRLPFEPKGWLRELKTEIGEAVRKLEVTDGELLHAVYASDARDPCDVENVLLYNVGVGCFRGAGHNGIRIERAFKASAPPEPVAGAQSHSHPLRLTIDAGTVAAGNRNPAQRVLGVRAVHGHDLPHKLRMYAFGAALGGDRVLAATRALARQSGTPRKHVVLVDRHRSYAHNDLNTASAERDVFLKRLIPFLRGVASG